MTSQIPFTPVTPEAMARLTLDEQMAFLAATGSVAQDQKPSLEVIATLVLTIQRLITEGARDAAESGVAAAARAFCETWAELAPDLPDSYGRHLTCGEADTLADLYRAAGDDTRADAIEAAHAAHDQPGDAHYQEAPGA